LRQQGQVDQVGAESHSANLCGSIVPVYAFCRSLLDLLVFFWPYDQALTGPILLPDTSAMVLTPEDRTSLFSREGPRMNLPIQTNDIQAVVEADRAMSGIT
jgi:hypothetical protein